MLSPQQKARIRPLLRSIAGGGNVLPLAAARRLAEQTGLPRQCAGDWLRSEAKVPVPEAFVDQSKAQDRLSLRAVEYFALEEGIVPHRYERNIGTLGLDGQRRLLAASALVVGAGGLGGYVLESLARLGVGRIAAVDNDRFSESDLNRQLLCDTGDLGRPKVQVAAERIARVNPAVEFGAYETSLSELDEEILRRCDVAFGCVDNVPARRQLASRCSAAGVVLVHGAVAGGIGQVAICRPGGDLMDRIYPGDAPGEECRLGVLSVSAGVAANLMVARALPVLLGREPAGADLRFFDLLEDEWQQIGL